jgi:hypothetical protein
VTRFLSLAVSLLIVTGAVAADPEVTGIKAVHRHGQTFVTWADAAEGEAGAKFRYSLYRSDKPIAADNLKDAELCYHGVLHNSARLFGTAFNARDRIDPKKPTARRCQKFKVRPNAEASWKTSDGASGKVVADAAGLVTVSRVKFSPGKYTVLTIGP